MGALIIEGTASNATFRRRLDNAVTLDERIEGAASNATLPRHGGNAFAIAERVEDTRRALITLGFSKHEVKEAIERARTHVGTAELSIEQWIKIALTYCPKPRGP